MSRTVALFTGARISDVRSGLGQSQAALARALGVVTPTVNKTEHAVQVIGIERLCQFALALGVEPGDLLPSLAQLSGMLGLGGIETLEPVKLPKGEEYLDAVAKGARSYIDQHGQRPRTNGGDATEHVGFDTTWCAIENALRRGCNGVPPSGGLHDFLDSKQIGEHRSRGRRQ